VALGGVPTILFLVGFLAFGGMFYLMLVEGKDTQIDTLHKALKDKERTMRKLAEALGSPQVLINLPEYLRLEMQQQAANVVRKSKTLTMKALPSGFKTKEQVLKTVSNLPEIKEFIQKTPKPISLIDGPEPFAIEGVANPSYIVEISADDGDHLTPYYLIYVDAKSGEVVKREHAP